jgi:hypothetical protein
VTQPTISDGVTTVTLNINQDLPESEFPNIVIHQVPKREGEILQEMGRGSKKIDLNGFTRNQAEKNSLKGWSRARTKLVYNDDENTNINVYILSFRSIRKPGIPGYYDFNITIIEDDT